MKSDFELMNELAKRSDYLRELTDDESKALKKTLLAMYVDIARLCEAHHLTVMLCGGSCLGAIRHKGFIPWDDDLDIGMPREDYEKFIEYTKKNPSNLFSLQDESNEKNWFLTFCKVRKNDTLFIESMSDGLYSNNGLFIDIFPLE